MLQRVLAAHLGLQMVPQQGHLGGQQPLAAALGGGLQQGGQQGGGQGLKEVTRHEGPQLVMGPVQHWSIISNGPFLFMYSPTLSGGVEEMERGTEEREKWRTKD